LASREVNHLQTIAGANAPQHSVDMILYRLLGYVQVTSDFLVRKSLGDQRNQLLLPPC
jgi:hypothetical protein